MPSVVFLMNFRGGCYRLDGTLCVSSVIFKSKQPDPHQTERKEVKDMHSSEFARGAQKEDSLISSISPSFILDALVIEKNEQ